MKMRTAFVVLSAFALFPLAAFAPPGIAAEAVLHAQSHLPRNHDLVQNFLKRFIALVDKKGKGVVRVEYRGGPEITPIPRAAAALKRGVIDILHGPSSYYSGELPMAGALIATNQTPAQVRANGGFAIMQKAWKEKLSAHILAWPETEAQYNIYLAKKPTFGKDGVLDLKDYKMRTTPGYRPILGALGATQISVPAPEMYTALQRGLVDGIAWPDVALVSMGVAPLLKYRIEPSWYHLSNLTIVNLDKWNSLPKAARDKLSELGLEYEKDSNEGIAALKRRDLEQHLASGAEVVEMKGKAAEKFLKIAYDAMWKRIAETMPKEELAAIKPKLYVETPGS